jgi:DNA-directed RNA polymerase specialized sigma24 family protein
MDQGYNLEAAELAEKAIKRLNVFKTDVEYLYGKDQYDKDELNYSNATVSGWAQLTVLQKDIVFMHAFQGFSLSGVADLKGISPQAASQAFHRACKHFQTI